jgi:SAM-dependent methyltransferase
MRSIFSRPYNPSARRYEEGRQSVLASTAAVVPFVSGIFPLRSVVDVGCGTGVWLNAFLKHGAERVAGIDGDYIDRNRLEIDAANFIPRDLNEPVGGIGLGRFDLAMSLEVGEHLLPHRADSLVDDLCALSDFVMYGAAIPGQSGEYHVNERWQSFWVAKFRARGYDAYDVLRSEIWSTPAVPFWYKQNILLYVKRGSVAHEHFRARFGEPTANMFDLVHPALYWQEVTKPRGLRRLAKNVARLLRPLIEIKSVLPAQLPTGDSDLTVPQRDRA